MKNGRSDDNGVNQRLVVDGDGDDSTPVDCGNDDDDDDGDDDDESTDP